MDGPTEGTAFRLPRGPYPGLRPFLDHEAALLLGRGDQVREIIARLRETHFVAVIGGSGSGKSSLIRAGVVPELRGLGIPDAGDYWVPVVCTPGTTLAPERGDSTDAAHETPVTRLAWKFSQQLDAVEAVLAKRDAARETGSPIHSFDPSVAAAHRRLAISTAFRQGAGFARLVEAYSSELPAAGPDRQNARFLFVIDQFEELFHPSNRENEDAKSLVEAIIDHFYNPHPRCFIVLTMRSEHLADCAGFLELPDAINRSSYLVRRLDETELREAIIGPAKYFLRLVRRGVTVTDPDLPGDIIFDDAVIERLLTDISKITGDPDHLPLLQHVLARTWEVACSRNSGSRQTPRVAARIEWIDFEHAVDPQQQLSPGWLHERGSTNTLRSSLENWAETTYQQRPEEERKLIDIVLSRLAFKDPNNGQYTQQRIYVDDPALLDAVKASPKKLRTLLETGFLDSVNYLFWDEEDPGNVTLKVSHESFIRGWERFRKIVNAEADRFEEFVAVLRRCAAWQNKEPPDRGNLLLEGSELQRFDDARLNTVLAKRVDRGAWFLALLQYRDGDQLGKMEQFVDAFVDESRSRLREQTMARSKGEKQKKWLFRALAVGALVVAIALPFLYFWFSIEAPVVRSVNKFSKAQTLVERVPDPSQLVTLGASSNALNTLLEAARLVEEGKLEGQSVVEGTWKEQLARLRPVARVRRLFVQLSPEHLVNGRMRTLLTTQVWRSHADLRKVQILLPTRTETGCKLPDGQRRGSLFYDSVLSRGIFFPNDPNAAEIEIYRVTNDSSGCVAESIIRSVPRSIGPLILLDAELRYVAIAQTSNVQPAVAFYRIFSKPGDEGLRELSVLATPEAVRKVQNEFNQKRRKRPPADYVNEVRGVNSWRELAGTGVSVAGETWRLFADGMRHIDVRTENDWQELAEPDKACESIDKALDKHPPVEGFSSQIFEHDNLCVAIFRGSNAKSMNVNPHTSAPAEPSNEQVLMWVYAKPTTEQIPKIESGKMTLKAIASLTAFDDGASVGDDWVIATEGYYAGWIGMRVAVDGRPTEYYAAPWSTSALTQLAKQVMLTPTKPQDRSDADKKSNPSVSVGS